MAIIWLREDTEALGKGGGTLDTTLQPGTSDRDGIGSSERKGPSHQLHNAALGSVAGAGLDPSLIPAHGLSLILCAGCTRGTPKLVVRVRWCEFSSSGLQSEVFFISTFALQVVLKLPGFCQRRFCNALEAELSLTPVLGALVSLLGQAAMSHHTSPSPLFSTDDYRNRQGFSLDCFQRLLKDEFLDERGKQPLSMAWPSPAHSRSHIPCRNTQGMLEGAWTKEKGCQIFPTTPVQAIL